MGKGIQKVKIFKSSDNSLAYTATTERDTLVYPATADGDAKMSADASNGYLDLTCDNGAIIPKGTKPPEVKPSAPGGGGGSIPAYSWKQQAEDASGTGTWDGSNAVGDGNSRGPYQTPDQYLEFNPKGVPTTANNYKMEMRIQTNYDTLGTGETGKVGIIINNGTTIEFDLYGGAGKPRTYDLTGITLNAGDGNKIKFVGINQRACFIDYIIISRPASS